MTGVSDISCRICYKKHSVGIGLLEFRSKYGFFDAAANAMAMIWLHPSNHPNDKEAQPAENITRESTRKSAATEQAEPTAMPKSMELNAQGTSEGFSQQLL